MELGRMCFSPNISVLLVPSVMLRRVSWPRTEDDDRPRGLLFLSIHAGSFTGMMAPLELGPSASVPKAAA
jgi:hypothetical protein